MLLKRRPRGSGGLGPPFDDPLRFVAGHGWSGNRAVWTRRRRYVERRAPLVRELCEVPVGDFRVPASWVLALLWDELARRDLTESATDWLLGKLGRDPSVGPYQVTGRTGCDVVAFVPWGEPYRALSPRDMRALLLDFSFATRVVIGRAAQIVDHWRTAGHDPLVEGGLGSHRVEPLALVGTLYSQGLGQPKADPRANARGLQIAAFGARFEG